MALDDGDFDDLEDEDSGEPTRPWLPPEDRIWRHPSELTGSADPRHLRSGKGFVRRRRLPVAVGAGVMGAVLATAVLAATGHLGSSKAVETTAIASTTSLAAGGSPDSLSGASGASQPDAKRSSGIAASPSVAQMAERVLPAMVTLEVSTRQGTRHGGGLVVGSNGMILTTYRLVAGASSLTAVTSSGAEESANMVGQDPDSDLAVLHVQASGLPTVSFGQPDTLAQGTVTIAVTVPSSSASRPADLYLGTVDGLDAQVPVPGGKPLLDVIETDAPVSGPVDGGALLDSQGLVVGLTSGTEVSGSSVRCLATPADLDQRTAMQLIATGRAEHAWLGIDGDNVSAGSPSLPAGVSSGVLVDSVDPNSPAASAGLQAGDLITSVDFHRVGSLLDLQGDIQLLQPGMPAEIGYYRGQSANLAVATLGSKSS